MSYTKKQLQEVENLCLEVIELVQAVTEEGNHATSWDPDIRSFVTRPRWPYVGGTAASGSLRRRSLDLTRALAEMRKH